MKTIIIVFLFTLTTMAAEAPKKVEPPKYQGPCWQNVQDEDGRIGAK